MSVQNCPELALIIPTYRWDARAKDTLTQAAAIGSDRILVHIGDNSANPDKHAFLNALAAAGNNVVVTCHPTNIGADRNWLYLFKAHDAPYYCMAADDDAFSAAYFRSGLNLLRDDPTCGTASGLHISVAQATTKGTPVVDTPNERLDTDPLKRIQAYDGHNSICYAVSRRASILDFVTYVETNPLQCPFNDYMLALHLLSIGTYRIDHRGYVYIYDYTNWQDDQIIIKSNARWYKGYDIPENFAYLIQLHRAVVVVHFFLSRFRSDKVTNERADAIVAYLFDRQRQNFMYDYRCNRSTIDGLFANSPAAAAAFARLVSGMYSHVASIFDDFAIVVAVFAPDVATRYRTFQAQTLLPHVDRINLKQSTSLLGLGTAKTMAKMALYRAFGQFR